MLITKKDKSGRRRTYDRRTCVICGKEFEVVYESKKDAKRTLDRISKNPLYKGSYKITCSKECNRKYRNKYMEDWRKKHPQKVKLIGRKADRKRQFKVERIKWSRKYMREWHQNMKFSVMAIYSEGQPKCTCCGESRIEFLCMDHIHGDGNKHRKETPEANRLAYWLKRNGFPEGFRVLCHNCNHSLGNFGYCPHELERKFKAEN